MSKSDEFDKIVRGDGTPATSGGFYNPRHARRMPRGLAVGLTYILILVKVWIKRRTNRA